VSDHGASPWHLVFTNFLSLNARLAGPGTGHYLQRIAVGIEVANSQYRVPVSKQKRRRHYLPPPFCF